MTTPSLATFIREQQEQRERQLQTSFPAKVIEYDSNTGTVTVEPQFIEAWRENGERVAEDITNKEDAYIANVPIAFPRAGNYSITFPVAADDYGLVTCTKYSLEVWRKAGTSSDPGDLRRFTMSGAVFHPVNLYPDGSNLTHADGDVISISAGGTTQFIALANLVDAELDKIKTELEGHEHTATWTDPEGSGPTSANTASYSKGDVATTTVKISE